MVTVSTASALELAPSCDAPVALPADTWACDGGTCSHLRRAFQKYKSIRGRGDRLGSTSQSRNLHWHGRPVQRLHWCDRAVRRFASVACARARAQQKQRGEGPRPEQSRRSKCSFCCFWCLCVKVCFLNTHASWRAYPCQIVSGSAAMWPPPWDSLSTPRGGRRRGTRRRSRASATASRTLLLCCRGAW